MKYLRLFSGMDPREKLATETEEDPAQYAVDQYMDGWNDDHDG